VAGRDPAIDRDPADGARMTFLQCDREVPVKAYLLSLAAGLLVGVIYSLLNVRSPAPPAIALVGLLGILVGEQVPPLIKDIWLNAPLRVSWLHQVQPHVFGHMPKGSRARRAIDGVAADAGVELPASTRLDPPPTRAPSRAEA
jgi:XapX domain-containing protein